MPPRRSPLFSAVVLAGVSLASACSEEDNAPAKNESDASADAPGDTGTNASGDAASDDPSDASSDACPPDAELPTPPCYLIK